MDLIPFEGHLDFNVREELFPPLRRQLITAGILKGLPTFVFFAFAYAFRVPNAGIFELVAVSVIAVAGTGYFIAREFEAASTWWSSLVARFPHGISGFADAERLVIPALDLSVPWAALNPIVATGDGFLLSTAAGTMPLHASMCSSRTEWEVLCEWLATGLEHRHD